MLTQRNDDASGNTKRQKLAEMIGGGITCTSEPGKGSTFVLTL